MQDFKWKKDERVWLRTVDETNRRLPVLHTSNFTSRGNGANSSAGFEGETCDSPVIWRRKRPGGRRRASSRGGRWESGGRRRATQVCFYFEPVIKLCKHTNGRVHFNKHFKSKTFTFHFISTVANAATNKTQRKWSSTHILGQSV